MDENNCFLIPNQTRHGKPSFHLYKPNPIQNLFALCIMYRTTSGLITLQSLIVKAMDCGIIVSEFELQSNYYVHFMANTLRKGTYELPYPPSYGFNSTTTVLLGERLWH